LYQRLGGNDALNAMVVDAIGNIATDARINQRFSAIPVSRLQKNLVDLLCVRTGGPCKYSGLDMSAAHEGMNIRDDEFDALAQDFVKSLDKFKVPAREKAEVLTILNQMRNAIVGH
jgi:hemoglobin